MEVTGKGGCDMRKIKLIAFLLSVTSCLLLFSVGFSTWYNVKYPTGITTEGSVEAYDVLTIENAGMDIFRFSMFSFKTATYDGTTLTAFKDSSTGVISVTYRVPAETLAATGNSFKVDASLSYDATTLSAIAQNDSSFEGLFSKLTLNAANKGVSVSCEATTGTITQVTATTVSGTEIKGTYKFEGVTANAKTDPNKSADVYEFTIKYTFNISSGTGFKDTFGQYLNGTDNNKNGTKFIASANVTKVS